MRSDTASGTWLPGRGRAMHASDPEAENQPEPAASARSRPPKPRPIAWRRVTTAVGLLAGVTIFATCESTTGPRSGHIVVTYTGDTVLTAASRTAASISVTVDGSPYATPRLVLHSSDTTVLGIVATANGTDTLIARSLGTATLTIQMVNSVLAGPPPTITKTFLIAPQSVQFDRGTLPLGSLRDTITVPAHAYDVHGTEISNVAFSWTSSDTTIARVTNKGRITAIANGSSTVRASVGGDTATLTV